MTSTSPMLLAFALLLGLVAPVLAGAPRGAQGLAPLLDKFLQQFGLGDFGLFPILAEADLAPAMIGDPRQPYFPGAKVKRRTFRTVKGRGGQR